MITKKVILLLGASSDQLFAIKTAKEMGLHTIVVDGDKLAPGFSLSDEHFVISTRDIDALKCFVDEYQQKRKIDAVSVMGSDIPQYVAELAAYIGVPHIPIESALLTTNKLAMKKHFLMHSIPIPWFSEVDDFQHLLSIIDERGLPIIIKPLDRSGARGVFLIKEVKNLENLYNRSKELSFCKKVMAEEYLPGVQISTESIICDGVVHTPGFVDRNYEMLDILSPNIIENGGWQPSSLDKEKRNEIESLIASIAKSLGIENGVIKGDIVYTTDGAKVIEVATRLSGGDFSESLIPLGLGVNYVKTAFEIALGIQANLDSLTPKNNVFVANRYFFPKSGVLQKIDGIDDVKAKNFVKKLTFKYKPGEVIPEITDHSQRAGLFIVIADNKDELESRIKWVYDNIVFHIA